MGKEVKYPMLTKQDKAEKEAEIKLEGLDDNATQWDSNFWLVYIGGGFVRRPLFWALKESMLEEREETRAMDDPKEWSEFEAEHHTMINNAKTMKTLIKALNEYDDRYSISMFLHDAIVKVAKNDTLRYEEVLDLVQAIAEAAHPLG